MAKGVHIGLTGGMGSGKSTVADFLTQRGAFLIDADAISRRTTESGGAAIPIIAEVFGSKLIDCTGALDRAQMRRIAFTDASARLRLEAIIHPLVKAAIEQAALSADALGAPCVAYDIPLLIESEHWRHSLESILVVDCTPETQFKRIQIRSCLADHEISAMLAAQAPRLARLKAADHVIFNEGIDLVQLESLTHQIGSLFGL